MEFNAQNIELETQDYKVSIDYSNQEGGELQVFRINLTGEIVWSTYGDVI